MLAEVTKSTTACSLQFLRNNNQVLKQTSQKRGGGGGGGECEARSTGSDFRHAPDLTVRP